MYFLCYKEKKNFFPHWNDFIGICWLQHQWGSDDQLGFYKNDKNI